MPTEQSDNTRVNLSHPRPLTRKEIEQLEHERLSKPRELYIDDADEVDKYSKMQDAYNSSFFYTGPNTYYDPSRGLVLIQSNYNNTVDNAKTLGETLATTAIGEGAVQALKWATTPVKIGEGAESVVTSSPLSTRVTKVTRIGYPEAHIRNTVPGSLRLNFKSSANGVAKYTQLKVKVLTKELLAKAQKSIDNLMRKGGWRKVEHPKLLYPGYTNRSWVVSDLGEGNVGRDWLGRIRLLDFSLETVPEFRLAMMKHGNKISNKN